MSAGCHTEPVASVPAPSGARRVLLVGRPNSGKSSMYNAITGGSAHVGNFPGITVDLLEARVVVGESTATVVDLPGFYTLSGLDPDTDEGIAARVLRDDAERSVIVQVLDSTRLALGLRLTRELLALGRPLVVAATQRDLVESEGRALDVAELERTLGVPVLWLSARDPEAARQVLERAMSLREAPAPRSDEWDAAELARRVSSVGPTRASSRGLRERTDRLDRWLLQPVLGPLLFLALMALAFSAVFLIADPVTEVIEGATGWLGDYLVDVLGEGWLSGLLVDGVLAGAGTVLIFMPQIVILTVVMELLEASGYLARGAFLMDRALRSVGLSGRAFLPLLMGHACAVPAIGATRIIRDPKERLVTILVLPLMACSARIPTYALFLTAFFPDRSALFRAGLFIFLYFAGMLSGAFATAVIRRTSVKGRGLPLVLEMPLYRAPQGAVVWRKAVNASRRFLRDVGTTIVVASAILFVLLNVPARAAHDADEPLIERSVAATVGKALEPVTRPAGFDWRINVGLIGSFGARELMVGTMGVIFGVENSEEDSAPLAEQLREAEKPDGTPLYSTAMAAALLAFFVVACQCMSTVAAIRRETRSLRWPAFVVGYTYLLGYVLAVITYNVVGLFS